MNTVAFAFSLAENVALLQAVRQPLPFRFHARMRFFAAYDAAQMFAVQIFRRQVYKSGVPWLFSAFPFFFQQKPLRLQRLFGLSSAIQPR